MGTIIGSNIFNILAIMGVASAASSRPIEYPGQLPLFGSSGHAGWQPWPSPPSPSSKRPIGRKTGITFVSLYVAYIAVLFLMV